MKFLKIDMHTGAVAGIVGAFTFAIPEPLRNDALWALAPVAMWVINWPGHNLKDEHDRRKTRVFTAFVAAALFLIWAFGVMAPGMAREYGPWWLESTSASTISNKNTNAVRASFAKSEKVKNDLYLATVTSNQATMMPGIEVFRTIVYPVASQWQTYAIIASIAVFLLMCAVQAVVWLIKE